jgi:hypothetical protein
MGSGAFRVAPITIASELAAWDQLSAGSRVGHRHQCLWWVEPLERYGFRHCALGCWRGETLVGGALFRSYRVPFTGTTMSECLDGPIFLEWHDSWADEIISGVASMARAAGSMAVTIRDCPDHHVQQQLVAAFRRAHRSLALLPGPADTVLGLEGRTIDGIKSGFNHRTRQRIKKTQPAARGVDEFKLGFGDEPARSPDTIVWKRRPVLYDTIQRLRHGRLGRALEQRLRLRLIRRGGGD